MKHFWERVRFYGATQSFTIGAMHMFLWNAPPRPDDADNPLRELQAVPMPGEIREPFSQRFGVKIMGQGMSQSEAMVILRQDTRKRSDWPLGSCGNPVDSLDVMLADDAGNEVPVGEPGELWVRPRRPFVIFNGYFDDPGATANAFAGDWYKTGDMLRRDAGDNYFFVDRKKDAVRYKGRNISTYEVELVARRHPAIADCAAFGIPAEELKSEDEIKLNVIVKPGAGVTRARDRAVHQRQRAVLLRAALHRVRDGAAVHAEPEDPEIQAARGRPERGDLGREQGGIQGQALIAGGFCDRLHIASAVPRPYFGGLS